MYANLKQGFFIFFFYVVRQEKVSDYILDCIVAMAVCLHVTWVK